MSRIHVELTRTIDVAAWMHQWERNSIADRLPYGIDRLGAHGFTLTVRRPLTSTAFDLLLAAPLRYVSGQLELAEATIDSRLRRQADVVLSWDERTGVPAGVRSSLPGEPPAVSGVIWATEPERLAHRARSSLVRRGLAGLQAVFTLSRAQHDVLVDVFDVDPDRLHYLPFGIDADFWAAEPRRPPPSPLVLSAGNDRHRDHELLLAAYRTISRACPTASFGLIADQAIPRVDVPLQHHRVLDHPSMRERYREATVVAIALRPNLHASGVTVLLEAMAAARPVVISRTGGIEDYVEEGRDGILVPPGDAPAMAEAVIDLLRDPARAAAMGEAGRQKVLASHSTSTMTEELAGILRTVGGRRS